MLLGIGLAALAIKSDSVKASAYGTGEPAGLTSNMTGNMTGNTTTSGEESLPTSDPAGADLGRGPQDKFLTDEPGVDE